MRLIRLVDLVAGQHNEPVRGLRVTGALLRKA
ncbi:hypothetical protein FHX44_114917 [Pseudonocardia hierapolitana]|uniref:Uncharacterized protein n=1 Tax=Pseudonocardia hierapolitana TaxID=1128676 RepID=A0A561SVX9_9PSEU|nr:hypothetical protein FHX44_114917 [Pseudonocardia hierapolitana]